MKKSTLLFLAFILTACSTSSNSTTPTPQATVTLPPTPILAQKPSADEMAQLNRLLQTQLMRYQGDPAQIVRGQTEAVCSGFERYVIEGGDEMTLCRTVVESEDMLVAFTQAGEAVELVGATVGNVKVYGIWTKEGKIANSDADGSFFMPFVGKGADGEDYIYSETTKQYHRIEGGSEVLNELGVNKLLDSMEGGTLVEPQKIKFDNGMEWILEDNGDWVEAVPKATQAAVDALEKYKIDPDTYTISVDGGVATVTDKETEKVIMISTEEGIRYDLGFAVDQIAAKSCEPTDIKPSPNDGLVRQEISLKLRNYFNTLRDELAYYGGYNFAHRVLVNREEQCWGEINDGREMIYRDANKVGYLIRIIPMTSGEVDAFVVDR